MPKVSRAVALRRQEEVAALLRRRIADTSGTSDFLPPERTLAAELGVSRPVLRRGLRALLETGELVSHPGIGTRVAPLSVRKRINMRAPRIIGLLLPDLGSPFFSEIAESVEYAALQHGYQVLLCNSQHQLAFEERHLAQLAAQAVGGVILAHDPYMNFPEAAVLLREAGIPYVALFTAPSTAECDSVAVDDFSGVEQAMRYLVSLGHEAIGFCRPIRSEIPHPREQAYRKYMLHSGLPVHEHFIVPLDSLEESRYAHELPSLFARNPSPTAFVAGNDQTALLLMKRLSSTGRQVPKDISVIGFDNLAFAELLPTALTTVNQPKREMGRRALEILLEHIELSSPTEPRHEVFETYLIIRDSCAGANGA
jgi:DNA-binding LacI/PurR family transcriptional regulator